MIVYAIEGYDITGSSSVYGSKVFPTQERANEYLATLNILFKDIEFFIQEFESRTEANAEIERGERGRNWRLLRVRSSRCSEVVDEGCN